MEDLRLRLVEIRARVEERLDAALRSEAGFPESLRQAMRYSLLAPGKRLRPALVVLAAEACAPSPLSPGGSGDGLRGDPWPAACAVEMIHAYSLIHDDLPAMDDDDLRRGLPTCHKKFGEALAILAGDALQTTAFQVLAEAYPPTTAVACCKELARAAGPAGMIGGQVDDMAQEWRVALEWRVASGEWREKTEGHEDSLGFPDKDATTRHSPLATRHSPLLETLERLHARKTGALIRASLKLGALAAHAPETPPPETLERLDGYGWRVGLAFQITDDLLDVEGSADRTGKRVGKDAAHGKLTYPGLLGADESRRRAERLCREARDQLAPFGPAAAGLLALASFVLERDR